MQESTVQDTQKPKLKSVLATAQAPQNSLAEHEAQFELLHVTQLVMSVLGTNPASHCWQRSLLPVAQVAQFWMLQSSWQLSPKRT